MVALLLPAKVTKEKGQSLEERENTKTRNGRANARAVILHAKAQGKTTSEPDREYEFERRS